jgi:hypothetical protein
VQASHLYAPWIRVPRAAAIYMFWFRRKKKRSKQAATKPGSGMLLSIFALLIGIVAITHYFACIWWVIGTKYLDRVDPGDVDLHVFHWVLYYHGLGVYDLLESGVSIGKQYFFSYYWVACTMSTASRVGVATPKNVEEILFTTLCMLTTLTIYAYVMVRLSPCSTHCAQTATMQVAVHCDTARLLPSMSSHTSDGLCTG